MGQFSQGLLRKFQGDTMSEVIDLKKLAEAMDALRPDWDKRTTEEWLAEFLGVSGVVAGWKQKPLKEP